MTPFLSIQSRFSLAGGRVGRAGVTLLEVLVSMVILIAGLSGIAALLPAAGARLADATAIDRAATLGANAHADLRNRGLLTASLFPANTNITGSTGRICVMGDAFPNDPFASGTYPFSTPTSGTFTKYAIPASLPTFTMTLQDNLQVSGTTISTNATSVSYAATIVPTATGTVAAGTPVRVGVVIFKRPNAEWKAIQLQRKAAGIFQLTTSNTATQASQNEADRKRFLSACSWTFATSGTSPTQSQWVQVGSSWMISGSSGTSSFISFSNAESSVVQSGTITVQAFTNVLRVDEQPAILK